MIQVLDQATINKIAAGEVVERPSSVVKELVENAIDAGATAITVEIKEGGLSFIRITDNGVGIEKNEVATAFVRHATSKIITIEDLLKVRSLGFRGEALASIAAVSQVELITKTAHALTGIRYEIHGGSEIAREEIGAPTGTTIIIRNLFYNVPARKKFLKTPMTEGGYITDLMTRLALSRPDVSFKYIVNGNHKIATSGNGNLKDVIYHIYGKDVSSNLLQVTRQVNEFRVDGYIGKAFVSKGNRSFEHYFVNDRSIRNTVITKAIEEAYKSFVMIHKFPFTALHFTLDGTKLDVNIHPAKMEFKYADSEGLFTFVKESVRDALLQEEMIPDVSLRTAREEKAITIEQQRKSMVQVPEPFEIQARTKRYPREEITNPVEHKPQRTEIQTLKRKETEVPKQEQTILQKQTVLQEKPEINGIPEIKENDSDSPKETQLVMPLEQFVSKEARKKHKIIGQIFQTYWIVEYDNKMYIMDQHAAHEKVMFERLMKQLSKKTVLSQQLLPPAVIHLNSTDYTLAIRYMEIFRQTGFEMEDFGDDSVIIRGMPDDIMGVDPQALFDALLNALAADTGKLSIDFFVEKLSGMACKAAIKGNTEISIQEADALIDELLTLDNPYNCPHGRPTMISLTKTELERKFKRIQN